LIKDLQNSGSGGALPSHPKGISRKHVSLAKRLQEAQSELMPLVEPFDNNRTRAISVDNFCRALYQFSSARTVAKLVMNPKTHEIDDCQLQADLDSVQFPPPSD
jgi:hypothetical protein